MDTSRPDAMAIQPGFMESIEAAMPSAPWGKLQRSLDQTITHGLLDHMTDVASVLHRLLLIPAVARALQRTAGRCLSDTDRARLTVLAYLHDIGKANAGFQGKYWSDSAQLPTGWPGHRGHGPEGWDLIDAWLSGQHWAQQVATGLPLAVMCDWGDAFIPLLHASISHHGRPVQCDGSAVFWSAVPGYDPVQALTAMGQAIQVQYPEAFVMNAPELPNAPAFGHLFAGLVQLADWLGSDTRAGFFAYSQPGEIRSKTAPAIADKALTAIGLIAEDGPNRPAITSADFGQVFGLPSARPMQASMADDALGPVVVLEAETGSGKTEAALWRFLHLWRADAVDALYFALPTRVAATQLYERVHAFVQRAWNGQPPVVVRALPGYTAADGQSYEPLPDYQVL